MLENPIVPHPPATRRPQFAPEHPTECQGSQGCPQDAKSTQGQSVGADHSQATAPNRDAVNECNAAVRSELRVFGLVRLLPKTHCTDIVTSGHRHQMYFHNMCWGLHSMHVWTLTRPRDKEAISLGDIHCAPTRWGFPHFPRGFLNSSSDAPKYRSLWGGGMCILFEICEKRPFQKCMG